VAPGTIRAMKTTKAAKGERSARRKAKEHRRRDGLRLMPVGGRMDPDLQRRILAAFERIDVTAPWRDIAPMVLPVLKRVHHPYPPAVAPVHIHVPPGIPTGFGIDVGPAFSHVTAAMMEAWAVDHATLLATALDNLRHLVTREPPRVEPFSFAGEELLAVQGQGWGSALLLVPDVLAPILGPGPRILLAPVRNTLVALPDEGDIELATAVWTALADGAHDELDVDPFRWTGSTIVSVWDGSRGLPN
jgi:hypothetical protein